MLDQRVAKWMVLIFAHAESSCDQGFHELRVGYGGQLHQPNSPRKTVKRAVGCLQSEPGLACAPGAHDRHQPAVAQQAAYLLDLSLASHEAREWDGEVVRPSRTLFLRAPWSR